MSNLIFCILCFVLLTNYGQSRPALESKSSVYAEDLEKAEEFLKDFDARATDITTQSSELNWKYETDLTEENLKATVDASVDETEFFLQASDNTAKLKTLDLPPAIERQITIIRRNADSTSGELRREVRELEAKMTSIFGKAKVPKKKKDGTYKNLTLEPDLTDIMRKSRKPEELLFAWHGWRNAVGPPMKPLYEKMIDLLNIGAREHGWIDYGNFLRSEYEQGDDFELSLTRVWEDIKPLYEELHAYVRFHLRIFYGKKVNISKSGTIPAHLLGDMFAQDWENIFDLVKPFPNAPKFDVTKSMKKQKYTAEKIFRCAESFFKSIGLFEMPKSFWENSVIRKPKKKEMVCHASAWDFSNGDVRIKMCTEINQEDLITVHHEMGHVEYFLAYKGKPYAFRNGANPGFHEAIGDTVSLSVETPRYLKKIKLLDEKQGDDDQEGSISFLLHQALRRVAPIPYNYLVDKWRWRVFEGNVTQDTYNREWWKLRTLYQGVSPPVERKEDDFDPASKYHIGANVPYIAYFVSYVLQFQFHRALCHVAGQKGPLHKCSIYESKEAGEKFRDMLEAGRSKPWPKILKSLTGERDLSASAILEYFRPLQDWLKEYRHLQRYPIGWTEEDLSSKVLQRKAGRFEPGQERSGILKTNNNGISLSINIPGLTVGGSQDGLSIGANDGGNPKKTEGAAKADNVGGNGQTNATGNGTAANGTDANSNPGNAASTSGTPSNVPVLDLAKLLGTGGQFSITTSETNAMNQDGSTTVTNKEVDINSKQGESETPAPVQNANDNSTAGMTSSNDTNAFTNNSNSTSTGNSTTPGSNDTSNISLPTASFTGPSANTSAPVGNDTAAFANNSTASNFTTTHDNSALFDKGIETANNPTTNGTGAGAGNTTKTEAAFTRNTAPCRGQRRSPIAYSYFGDPDCVPESESSAVSVTPGELVQHLLLKKVKSLVQKSIPQARVEKSPSGFTVNLDLNPKDKIPSKTIISTNTRQQHVNVYIAPKQVVVKPKSSEQLMKPSFVPISNKDNLELRGGKK